MPKMTVYHGGYMPEKYEGLWTGISLISAQKMH